MAEISFQVTALDDAGDMVINEHTFKPWGISELQAIIDSAKMDLYTGRIKQLIIERVDNGQA